VIKWLPTTLGVYETLQLAIPGKTLDTVQLTDEKVPAEPETKVMFPVG